MKVSIIGMGRVGSTLAYTLVANSVVEELVLCSGRVDVVEGESLDLQHAASFAAFPTQIEWGGLEASVDSDLVVITSSIPWDPSFSGRGDFGRGNYRLFRKLIPQLAAQNSQAMLLVISNPVDVMTWHALQLSGLPRTKVFGTGTLIDTARFRTLLSQENQIHPDDVRAYILGEHGESQFPLFSRAVAGGLPIEETAYRRQLFLQASQSGHEVVRKKGYTNYAISQAASLVIECIAEDSLRTIPLSVSVDGFEGENGVCLSLPVVLGRSGIRKVLRPEFSPSERESFAIGSRRVRGAIAESMV